MLFRRTWQFSQDQAAEEYELLKIPVTSFSLSLSPESKEIGLGKE